MTFPLAAAGGDRAFIELLAHVRWIVGGTGTSKSTLTEALARRHNVLIYNGDRAEHGWVTRSTQREHPHPRLFGAAPEQIRAGRSAREIFQSMADPHGETIGFLIVDLLALPCDRMVLVDYFGVLPRGLGPPVAGAHQAVFPLPPTEFRHRLEYRPDGTTTQSFRRIVR
ncbi:hypothetical protein [Rhizohabitans arisaemae]|uniref:hypothetical protein n=1 Tax=Rhizohabitans arisaemae TaxID=2720610 RepID=UPI0024B27595|nr:hypothetical protein [Rhizohabitans arisaemae]